MTVLETSVVDLNSTVLLLIRVKRFAKTINTLLSKMEDGVLVTILSPLQSLHILRLLITYVTKNLQDSEDPGLTPFMRTLTTKLPLIGNGLVVIKMMVQEISAADQRIMVTIKLNVKPHVRITNTSLFKTEDGVLVIILSQLQLKHILRLMTICAT